MTSLLVLPQISGVCIDCQHRRNIIQQGKWQGFCYGCATDALAELRRLEADDR